MSRLSPLEIAAGVPFGSAPHDRLPRAGTSTAAGALEEVLLPCLQTGRVFVAFSGGRDSSIVLAAATQAARRHGLPLPVPVTMAWPDLPSTDETQWQLQVLRSLAISDWVRIDAEDTDLLGAAATKVLLRHGVLYPPPAFALQPLHRVAAGATLLTGEGGDLLFGEWRWVAWGDLRALRRAPRLRDARTLAWAASPRPLRQQVEQRCCAPHQAWLTVEARAALRRAQAAETAAEPLGWNRYLQWAAGKRVARVAQETAALLASDHGATVAEPLLAPRFLEAAGRAGGPPGFGGRTAALCALFGDLLPHDVLRRRTKAQFFDAFWGPATRRFVAEWDGSGIDRRFIDPLALQAVWASGAVPHTATTSLHAAWLESASSLPQGVR